MKKNQLTIIINRSTQELFDFTLNPKNTPKWIADILQEQTDELRPHQGTKYKNQNMKGEWSEYTITKYEKNRMFLLTKSDNNYHVMYTFTPINQNTTKFEYYEWVVKGTLDEPIKKDVLEKLKSTVESL